MMHTQDFWREDERENRWRRDSGDSRRKRKKRRDAEVEVWRDERWMPRYQEEREAVGGWKDVRGKKRVELEELQRKERDEAD